MNRLIAIASVLLGIAACTLRGPATADPASCGACHDREAREYAATAMARAAQTPAFRREWRDSGRPEPCLACHAPRGGAGVTCADCHGEGGHPYPAVAVPERCARCHDAPGENTVRSFLASPARRRGAHCLSCHALEEGRFSHRFKGPSRPEFLSGVARLRAVIRFERGELHTLVQIRHTAGHALPGGTTGRAVWLWIEGLDRDQDVAWRECHRFGWEHGADGAWRDRTLPAGQVRQVEAVRPRLGATASLRLRLTYHYRAGAVSVDDDDAVLLDRLVIDLPRRSAAEEGVDSRSNSGVDHGEVASCGV